jgi:polyphosphate kinase 2 (PPK2 family)
MRFHGQRAVVVFEGMDGGKGGTIRRIAWALDPRALKVWLIGAPGDIEAGSTRSASGAAAGPWPDQCVSTGP